MRGNLGKAFKFRVRPREFLRLPFQFLLGPFVIGHVLQGLDGDDELMLAVVDWRGVKDDVPVFSVQVRIPAFSVDTVRNEGRPAALPV